MTLPILYSFRRCPYAMRARIAIFASGLVCELREVALADKPDALLLASPKATIPVLVLPDGRVLDESLDIMIYALEQNDPDNWLETATGSAVHLVETNDSALKHHLDRYKYPQRYESNFDQHRDAGMAILQRFDSILSQQRFLTADSCSLVDVAIFPFVRQFAAVNEAWFASQSIPFLAAWLNAFLGSEMFKTAMATYPIWKPGDVETHFPQGLAAV
jgi:glutathione S-transferase